MMRDGRETRDRGLKRHNPRRITIDEHKAPHIFRARVGHLPDTQQNRALLEDVANDNANRLGTDQFGNDWCAKTNADGTQIWVQVRNDKIINGGVNQMPRTFTAQAGLSSPTKPDGQ